jgi:hypothetical protein
MPQQPVSRAFVADHKVRMKVRPFCRACQRIGPSHEIKLSASVANVFVVGLGRRATCR